MQRLKLILAILLYTFASTAQTNLQKVHPSVWDAMQGGKADFFIIMKDQADISRAASLNSKEEKGEYVFKILRGSAEQSQTPIKSLLQAQNIDFQSFWIVNAIYTKGDLALIQELAQREDVAQIINNPNAINRLPTAEPVGLQERGVQQLTWGVQKIKADSVWALGYRGQNVVVAGEDTGYDWQHPALKSKYRGWNGTTADHSYNWYDAIHKDTSKTGNPCGYDVKIPCDDDRHGTHTMGTMVGSNDTLAMGVAPDAKWIGARNMDRGNGTLQSYVECFQFFLAPTDTANKNPNPKKAPHVINNSWYCSPGEGCNASNFAILEKAMNNCRAAGIVMVVSAGNSGPTCSSVDGPPAFFAKAFSVGATNITDTIANFSSRGPVTIDSSGRMKPNVSGPGVGVISSVPNNGLASLSGTSMSGPHIAGVVALMISANPALAGQVDTIERIIELTAKPMMTTQNCGTILGTQVPNNTYGFGRVDALAAVKKALLYRKVSKVVDNQSVIKVYPNPFSSEITFYTEGLTGAMQLDIFNLNGQSVFSTKQNTAVFNVDLPNLASGIYFYRLNTEGVHLSGKLIKN